MKNLTVNINQDEEVLHLAEFIRQKWTPIANLEALITDIRAKAWHAARAWFVEHDIFEYACELEDARVALLESSLGLEEGDVSVSLYDAVCQLLHDISRESSMLRKAALDIDGPWDFERRSKNLTSELLAKYPDLEQARPLGWDQLEPGYSDFDGMEAYNPKPDRDLFQGVHIEHVRAVPFPGRIALPYVMYDEKCQGQKARVSLVGAVYAHFLSITEFLNTHTLKAAIAEGLPNREHPEMLFEHGLKDVGHPLLKALAQKARPSPTKENFEAHLASKMKVKELTEEEREQLRQDNSQRIIEMLAKLKSQDHASQEQEEHLQRVQLLKAHLPA